MPGDHAAEIAFIDANAPALSESYNLLTSAQVSSMSAVPALVRGIWPAQGVVGLVGPSGSGKSFLVFSLLAAVCEGENWFGHRTTSTFVVYVALEGQAGIQKRIRAWESHHGRTLPDSMRFLLESFRLTSPDDVRELGAAVLAAGGGGCVLVLDTLNRAAPTSDENSSRDMGEILEAAKTLQLQIGGLVVLVHHTGKDLTKGMRGHSSLFAALDAVIEVSRDMDQRRWKLTKSKDGEDGIERTFKLEVVDLGRDDIGDPVTSCVVTGDTFSEEIRRTKVPTGANQKIAFTALQPLFKQGTLGRPGAPTLKRSIELTDAVIAVASGLVCDPDQRAYRARLAINGLVSNGIFGCHDGWLWLI